MKFAPASAAEQQITRLIQEQSVNWPLFVRGLKGLHESQTRSLRIDWYDVHVRHIPHRIASTTARVDAVSIQKRPCFLCKANLPPEEQGVALDSQFTAYCNPFPILDRHLTIVHNEHRPQAIAGHAASMIHIAQLLPSSFVIYNGPECGASAPDHLHFQACSREVFPIENESNAVDGLFIPDYGRRVLVLRDTNALALTRRVENVISCLAEVTGKSPEPLINLAAFYSADQWTVFVFPRSKHRPRVYDTGELTVSPATIDLAGVFVVPKAADFGRIQSGDIESIFKEVTLGAEAFDAVVARIRESK
jgi:hypothetical protein